MDRNLLGKRGELLAEKFLERKGYEVIEKNFRCRLGEIDLIAEEGGEIIFVEVKCRSGTAFGFPEEQVSWRKQRKLWRLAELYLKGRRKDQPARIDIVAILLNDKGDVLSMEVIPNAITLSGGKLC